MVMQVQMLTVGVEIYRIAGKFGGPSCNRQIKIRQNFLLTYNMYDNPVPNCQI